MSQPTISAHVSALEEELGVKLFDRMGRVVLPTQAAEILYRQAQRVFETLEQARAEILLVQDRVAGDLAIGGSTIPAHYILPEVLAGFASVHPDVSLQLHVADTRDVITSISRGDFLLGVVGAESVASDVRFERLLRDELVVIGSPHQFKAGSQLSLGDVLEKRWVMREQGSGTRRVLDDALSRCGVDIRTLPQAVSVESTQAVLQCVRAGLGISVTSRFAARDLLERGELVQLPVSELVMERHFYLAYNERRHLFPAAQYFMEYLRERCQQVVAPLA